MVPLAIGSIAATAVGAGIQAEGAQYQGKAQANLYNYQAGVAQANKILADQDANYARESGEVSAQQSGMKTRAEVGDTRAGFGASNVAGASQNRVLSSETEIGQDNAALIRANAAKRAFGFEVESAKDTAQGQVYTNAAQTSRTSADISSLSSIIGGASQVASKWLTYGQYFPGMTGGGGGLAGDNPGA